MFIYNLDYSISLSSLSPSFFLLIFHYFFLLFFDPPIFGLERLNNLRYERHVWINIRMFYSHMLGHGAFSAI